MQNKSNKNELNGRKLWALAVVSSTIGMVASAAPQPTFEIGYTFEAPSKQTKIADTIGQNYSAETHLQAVGPGLGPTLTADAAKHGERGLDFITFKGAETQPNYSFLWTKSSELVFPHGMTIAFWMKPIYLPDPTSGSIGTYGNTSAAFTLYWAGSNRGVGETALFLDATGKIGFYNHGNPSLVSTSSVTAGQWAHVALTWDDATDTVTLYLNGVVDATLRKVKTLHGGNSPKPSPLVFGIAYNVSNATPSQYRGYLDDIYLANKALTQQQIQKLMKELAKTSAGIPVMPGR